MHRKKVIIAIVAAAVSVSLVLGLVVLPRQSVDLSVAESTSETAIPDLGITYLPITPTLCDYYDLKVDSGVLVTEVKPGSPMDVASVKAGDVITSFNGTDLEKGVSLLGVMRTYCNHDEICLELCSNGECSVITFCDCCGTCDCECGGPVTVPIPTYE